MILFYFLRSGGLLCVFKMESSIPMVAMSVRATTMFSIMKLQDGLCLLWIIMQNTPYSEGGDNSLV